MISTGWAKLLIVVTAGALLLGGCSPSGPDPAVAPDEVAPTEESVEPDVEPGSVALTMFVDGVAWEGSVPSASYFEGGAPSLDPEGRQYIQLAFPSASGPDTRQLTFGIFGFTGSTGQWQDFAEVLFSGSATGADADSAIQGYQYDVPEQKTDFVLEVTKWESTGADSAIISGKFSGKLVGTLGAQPVVVTDGVFTEVGVVVYTEPF